MTELPSDRLMEIAALVYEADHIVSALVMPHAFDAEKIRAARNVILNAAREYDYRIVISERSKEVSNH